MARRQVRPRFWGLSLVVLMLVVGSTFLTHRQRSAYVSLPEASNRSHKVGSAPHWTSTAITLPMPLQGLSAGISRGVVYVAGGINTQSQSSVWELRHHQFVKIGALPDPVHDAALVMSGQHLLMIGGGTVSSTATIQEISLGATHGTHILAPLPVARSDLGAVWWRNAAYLVGGYGYGLPSNIVWRYIPGSHAVVFTRLPLGVRYAAVAQWNGMLYVVGGLSKRGPTRQAIQIDLKTGQAHRLRSYPLALQYAEAFAVNGTLWVAGGRTVSGWTAATYFWDSARHQWMKGPNLPEPAGYGSVVPMNGHQEWWVGGRTAGHPLNVVWSFTP